MIILGVGRSASQNMTKYPQESIKQTSKHGSVCGNQDVFSPDGTHEMEVHAHIRQGVYMVLCQVLEMSTSVPVR